MSPLISIIVPVFNTDAWLDECVLSLLAQTCRDFELLLVDDGSTDDSGRLCDAWAARDNRVMALHTANAGVSAARNRGLREARGDYVCFVDSDDWVDPQLLQVLLEGMEADVDWSVCSLQKRDPVRGLTWDSPLGLSGIFARGELSPAFVEKALESYWIFQPVCKLYRRRIIEEHGLTFDTSLSFGEDFTFNLGYLRHARKTRLTDHCLYFYRVLDSGLSSSFNEKKAISFRRIKNLMLDFLKENGLFSGSVRALAVTNVLNEYFTLVSQLIEDPAIPRDIKKQHFEIMRSTEALHESLRFVHLTDLSLRSRLALTLNTYPGWQAYVLVSRLRDVRRAAVRRTGAAPR
jgi:glycosyltransferase involved in cell wall biosynthesis